MLLGLQVLNIDNYEKRNELGETALHKIFETGNLDHISQVVGLVEQGKASIDVKTDVLSNPFHYAAHITDPKTLSIIFKIATADLLIDVNQLGYSCLSLAVSQDNAAFLFAAIRCFPEIIRLEQSLEGDLMPRYRALLHDIARANAQQCFAIVQSLWTEAEWAELNRSRVDGNLPRDVAIIAEHPSMFQLFAGYRRNNLPTVEWLAALRVAQMNINVPLCVDYIVNDAQAFIEYRLARAELDAKEDNDENIPELPLMGRSRI